MSNGKYRDFVRIEKPVSGSDGGGGEVGAWVTHSEEAAWIERIKSLRVDMERISGGGMGSNPVVRVHLQRHDLTEDLLTKGSGWRLVDVDTEITMNIVSSQDIQGRGAEIIVLATESAPN